MLKKKEEQQGLKRKQVLDNVSRTTLELIMEVKVKCKTETTDLLAYELERLVRTELVNFNLL